jgi:predicted HTH transcriptional regulator
MNAVDPAAVTPEAVLPDPELVAETYDRLRSSVMSAYRRLERDEHEARALLEDALGEQEKLRGRYPMFFPDAPAGGGRRIGNPDTAVMNRMLRTLAEHPNQTRKQLSRRLGLSDNWIGRVIACTNERGAYVAWQKIGRSRSYFLTEAGRTLVDGGGVRT